MFNFLKIKSNINDFILNIQKEMEKTIWFKTKVDQWLKESKYRDVELNKKENKNDRI